MYLFKLRKADDLKHLHESILPEDVSVPRCAHAFKLYDDDEETLGVYRLRLEE